MREIGGRIGVLAAAVALLGGCGTTTIVKTVTVPARSPHTLGDYEGTTSQGLPISLSVQDGEIADISFRWRARCADGRVHTNGIDLGGGFSLDKGSFATSGILDTGAHAEISGRISGGNASGTLSRWGNSAFDTSCPDRGVRWSARLARGGSGS